MKEALTSAADAKRAALSEFHLACQRNEFEAQQRLSKEIQQAHADLEAGEGEARVEYLGFVASLESNEMAPEDAVEARHQLEKDAHERRATAETRVQAAHQAYADRAKESRQELADQWAAINHDLVRRIQEIWAGIDPETVESDELAALASLTAEASQHVPLQP